MIVEMLFTEGNHICSVCVSNGHCDLQNMAQRLGIDHISLPYRYPQARVDASHERFAFDPNRCILCTRCVRVCDEVEGAHTWDVLGRGIESQIITDLNQPWGESTSCTSCGKCVQVCPTGALFTKGKSAGEMVKQRSFLIYLADMRGERRMSDRMKLATVWLDGCSGCHMSFLDMDERLLELLQVRIWSTARWSTTRSSRSMVDITLVEGAVSSEEDLHKIKLVREHTRVLVSLGDCAVTANVPSMRNPIGVQACSTACSNGGTPRQPAYVPLLPP